MGLRHSVIAIAILIVVVVFSSRSVSRGAVYRYRTARMNYGWKADFAFSQLLVEAARSAGECADPLLSTTLPLIDPPASSASVAASGRGSGRQAVIVGGANEGGLVRLFARDCPGLRVTGLEIQASLLQRVKSRFDTERSSFPNVQMLHMGMSDAEGEASFAGGDEGSEISSIMDPRDAERKRFADWEIAPYKVKVLPLPFIYKRHVSPSTLFYVVIDVEGHEPLVIRGMNLSDVAEQRRFPAFQFEVGGTWAIRDPRHPRGSWSLPEVAEHLTNHRYELFLIGERDLLRVDPGFFSPGVGADIDEGFGPILSPGNVLALRREFAHPAVVTLVDSLTYRTL